MSALKSFLTRSRSDFCSSGEIKFQSLQSDSSLELSSFNRDSRSIQHNSRQHRPRGRTVDRRHKKEQRASMPRFYSHHDQLNLQLKVGSHLPSNQSELSQSVLFSNVLSENRSSVIGQSSYSLSDCTQTQPSHMNVLFGFFEQNMQNRSPSSRLWGQDRRGASEPNAKETVSEIALEIVSSIKEHAKTVEASVLRCVTFENDAYPLVVYCALDPTATHNNQSIIDQSPPIMANYRFSKGMYKELYSIVRTEDNDNSNSTSDQSALCPSLSQSTEPAPNPISAHRGFICIMYKLLCPDDQRSLQNSWLSWTGAREIFKYSAKNWQLKRITLHLSENLTRKENGIDSTNGAHKTSDFAYVLLCEYDAILAPNNIVNALQLVERLRMRACGHVLLCRIN